MCHTRFFTVIATVILVSAIVTPLSAVTVSTLSSNNVTFFDPNASATDLANAGQATLAGVTTTRTPTFGFPGINNGVAATNTTDATFYRNTEQPTSVTFTLNTGLNPNGYDIQSVRSIAGWVGANITQSNQTFELLVSQVGSSSFSSLGTFTNTPFTASTTAASSTQTTVTDASGVLTSNVDIVRVNLTYPGIVGNNNNPGTVYREIDIEGVVASAAAPVTVNLIQNGSFENPVVSGFQGFNTGSQFDAANWMLNGDATLVNGQFGTTASDGAQWLSLESFQQTPFPNNVGTVSQDVVTAAGGMYELTFDYNALGNSSVNTPWELTYDFGQGATTLFIPNSAHLTLGAWEHESVIFQATGPLTTFSFTGETKVPGFYGAAIDNVSLVRIPDPAIPEPATATLGLFAFGGLAMRRRRAG